MSLPNVQKPKFNDKFGKPIVAGENTFRNEASLRILEALIANPAVIAPCPRKGWEIVNCDESGLANYAVELADHLIERLG